MVCRFACRADVTKRIRQLLKVYQQHTITPQERLEFNRLGEWLSQYPERTPEQVVRQAMSDALDQGYAPQPEDIVQALRDEGLIVTRT